MHTCLWERDAHFFFSVMCIVRAFVRETRTLRDFLSSFHTLSVMTCWFCIGAMMRMGMACWFGSLVVLISILDCCLWSVSFFF